jgi:GntR family transcriptional regulator
MMWLSINEKDNRPIYLQIINQIKEQVGNGALKPGDELPSVRELAQTLGINLHTVRGAYLKLRDQGIIELRLGRKARVAHLQAPLSYKDAEARLHRNIKELVTEAQLAGLSRERLHQLIDRQIDSKKEE